MTRRSLWVPDRAEVILIEHSPAAGREIEKPHPMLVASTRAFNEKTGLVIGFPMTHAERYSPNPFVVPLKGPKGTAFILAEQPKSFDWKERGAKPHPLGGGHVSELVEALALLNDIIGYSEAGAV